MNRLLKMALYMFTISVAKFVLAIKLVYWIIHWWLLELSKTCPELKKWYQSNSLLTEMFMWKVNMINMVATVIYYVVFDLIITSKETAVKKNFCKLPRNWYISNSSSTLFNWFGTPLTLLINMQTNRLMDHDQALDLFYHCYCKMNKLPLGSSTNFVPQF